MQVDLHNYLRAAFAASDTPRTTNRGTISTSVHQAVTSFTDVLKVLNETVEGLRAPFPRGDLLPLLFLFRKWLYFFVQIWFVSLTSSSLSIVISSHTD